jgi:hypothetical protein
MMSSLIVLLSLLFTAFAQEQVFITLTGKFDSMAVSWVTQGSSSSSEAILYGTSPSSLTSSAVASSSTFDDSGNIAAITIHNGVITSLLRNTWYYYSVGGNSTVYSFFNHDNVSFNKTYAIMADLGLVDDYAMDTILADAANNVYDRLIISGDFAYDFQDSNGAVGNEFMQTLSPSISHVPFLTCAGNHEKDVNSDFANYEARFAAMTTLGVNSGSNSSRWYSYEESGIHFIFLDSEIFSYGTAAQVEAQRVWATADLMSVNRSLTPFVIASIHKAGWEKDTDWSLYLNNLCSQYQVDLIFVGHTHNYQRNFPMINAAPSDNSCVTNNMNYTNCVGSVVLTVGSPGMSQGMGTRLSPADLLILNYEAWGYGYLKVYDEGSQIVLHWYWFETVVADGNQRKLIEKGAGKTDEAFFIKQKV